jgi:2-methylcitrate dehydratase PrpD
VLLKVHPLVLELSGKRTPQTGLDGKFSVYHSAAVALIAGRAGEHQYSDAAVHDPQTIELRDKVDAQIDASMPPDAVSIAITLKNGERLEKHVAHAIGSVARPMNNTDLSTKFIDLAEPILGAGRAATLLAECWNLASLDDVATLAALAHAAD